MSKGHFVDRLDKLSFIGTALIPPTDNCCFSFIFDLFKICGTSLCFNKEICYVTEGS